jgi:hypothetical protein
MKSEYPSDTFDVVVYGATPSGIMAALSAARRGMRTLILEPTDHFGGMVTSGLNATDIGSGAQRFINGVCREFFVRSGQEYGKDVEWRPEPHVAEFVLRTMLAEEGVVVILSAEICRLICRDTFIQSALIREGTSFAAKFWIDSTYEGDLLPLAGVSHTSGRESRSTYDESHAGRGIPGKMVPWENRKVSPFNDLGYQIPLISDYDFLNEGDADESLQAFSFRLTLTRNPRCRIPLPKPAQYNPADYELFRRIAPKDASGKVVLMNGAYKSGYFNLAALPNEKYDMNSGHYVPMNVPTLNSDWLSSDTISRKRIYDNYKNYTISALHFIRTDSSVPENIRNFFKEFGLCRDEYKSTDGWPPMLYVREGRRLLGQKVLTEHDLINPTKAPKDHIGFAKYALDCKPIRWMISQDGSDVVREGMFFRPNMPPYPLPYGIMLPKLEECRNLLVSCAVSASHVAFSSVRMEPHWMLLGAAAGVAVSISCKNDIPLHEVSPNLIRNILSPTGVGK